MTIKTINIQAILKDIGITGPAAIATTKYLESLVKDNPEIDGEYLAICAGSFSDGYLAK